MKKRMKTTTSSYSYSSYDFNRWKIFAFGAEESEIQDKKSTKTHPKKVHRENGRCEICYEIEKKKMKRSFEPQEGKQEIIEKKVKVFIDENEKKKVKMDVIEENEVLGMDKGEAKEVKRRKMEEKKVENGEAEEGKIVIIDAGIDMEALLLGYSEAEENGDGGKMVEDFSSWNEWKLEAEKEWYCSYPFWETENGAFNFWDVEPQTNDWVVSLWNL